ncbi:MAG: hypothetical protein AB1498_04390 [bacterium]
MRKSILYFVFALLILFLENNYVPAVSEKPLGLGVSAGHETGPVLKYRFSRKNAVEFGIGFKHDAAIYGGYLWHAWDLFSKDQNGLLGGHAGFGLKIEENRDSDKLYLRTSAGLDYVFEKHPVELFLEAAPLFQVSPDTKSEFDILFGVRFYLK